MVKDMRMVGKLKEYDKPPVSTDDFGVMSSRWLKQNPGCYARPKKTPDNPFAVPKDLYRTDGKPN